MIFLMAIVVVNTFLVAATDKSKIPIGVVDLDNSGHSRLMIDNLKKNKLIKVNVYNKNLIINHKKESSESYLINKLEKKEINDLNTKLKNIREKGDA